MNLQVMFGNPITGKKKKTPKKGKSMAKKKTPKIRKGKKKITRRNPQEFVAQRGVHRVVDGRIPKANELANMKRTLDDAKKNKAGAKTIATLEQDYNEAKASVKNALGKRPTAHHYGFNKFRTKEIEATSFDKKATEKAIKRNLTKKKMKDMLEARKNMKKNAKKQAGSLLEIEKKLKEIDKGGVVAKKTAKKAKKKVSAKKKTSKKASKKKTSKKTSKKSGKKAKKLVKKLATAVKPLKKAKKARKSRKARKASKKVTKVAMPKKAKKARKSRKASKKASKKVAKKVVATATKKKTRKSRKGSKKSSKKAKKVVVKAAPKKAKKARKSRKSRKASKPVMSLTKGKRKVSRKSSKKSVRRNPDFATKGKSMANKLIVKTDAFMNKHLGHKLAEAAGLFGGGVAVSGIQHVLNVPAVKAMTDKLDAIPFAGPVLKKNLDVLALLGLGVLALRAKNDMVQDAGKGLIGASVVALGSRTYNTGATVLALPSMPVAAQTLGGIKAVPNFGAIRFDAPSFGGIKQASEFGGVIDRPSMFADALANTYVDSTYEMEPESDF